MKGIYNNLSIFLKKIRGRKISGTFSDFLLHAPQEEKIAIFREAAQKANEDQQKTIEQYHKLTSKAAS